LQQVIYRLFAVRSRAALIAELGARRNDVS
jgi:hypothetical protein